MRRLVLFATGVVIACSGFAGSLGAQMAPSNPRMPCHNATEIAKQLSNKYAEAPVAFGLQSNGNLLQVYASEEKGTWTVVSIADRHELHRRRWQAVGKPALQQDGPDGLSRRVVGASEGGGLGDASSSRGGVDPAGTARVGPGRRRG